MPDRLDAMFQTSHRLDGAVVGSLTAADVDRLREIVSGARPSPFRVRAMEALVVAATPDAPQLLGVVVADPGEDPAVRAAAASQLAGTGRPEAEDLLLRALPAAAPVVVRAKIVGGLARVGSRFSIPELDRLADDSEPAVSRLATFGRLVISYRAGLPGHEVPPPAPDDFQEVDARESTPVLVGRSGVEETAATLASLRTDTFGLSLSGRVGLRIECGLARLVVTFSEDFLRRGAAGPLRQPMMPGLVAQRAPDGTYSARMVLLAGPQDDGGFHIAVYRTDGNQMMFGLGTPDREGARFDLRSVRGRGNVPVLLRGRIQSSEIVFTAAASSPRVTEKSAPRPLEL
jgi:hypothetical protein